MNGSSLAFIAFLAFAAAPVRAQEAGVPLPIGLAPLIQAAGAPHRLAGPLDDLARTFEIARGEVGSRLIRRLSDPDSATWRIRLDLLPAGVRMISNSAYPSSANDGLVWAGRGLSAVTTAGVRVRWGPLSAAIGPELAWQQNRAFDIHWQARPGYHYFAYPLEPDIDWPQRFGSDPYTSSSFGGTHVRLDAYGAAVGFSTENLWWGPASRYPILMSSTAAGFPHYFLGTSRPLDVWIGRFETEIIWGRLTESDYYDFDAFNDATGFMALVGAFYPRWPQGLSLGFARAYQYREAAGEWNLNEQTLREMFFLAEGNRAGNELLSFFGRWILAPGAEVYGELAREDRFNDYAELVQEPDHSLAVLAGFQQVHDVTAGLALRTRVEVVSLQNMYELRDPGRPLPVFYTHFQIEQGYTHEGQLLGAWIGPGGDAQFLGIDALSRFGVAGAFLERIRRANASTAAILARRHSPYQSDTEVIGGIRAVYPAFRDVVVSGSLSRSFRYNREFLDVDEVNWNFQLEAVWTPSSDR